MSPAAVMHLLLACSVMDGLGSTRYKNDRCGNRITAKDDEGTTHYEYSVFDQLTKVTLPDGRQYDYRYDAFGRRISKSALNEEWNTTFYWNGFQLLAEETSGKFANYVNQSDQYVPVAMLIDDIPYFYWTDHLGTPLDMFNEAGDQVWTGYYTAYGHCHIDGNIDEAIKIKNNIRFLGRYNDDETNLHYNMLRTYDPQIGRYFEKDPIGLKSGDYNFWRYVFNDPLNWIDSEGTSPCSEAGCLTKLTFSIILLSHKASLKKAACLFEKILLVEMLTCLFANFYFYQC